MKIKKIVLMLVLVSGPVFANNNVKLDKVTLFLQGAELQGQSTVAIEKGENRILLTGVADGINPNSINVGFGNDADVTILSTTLKNNYLLKNIESDELKSLRDKLKQLQTKYRSTEIQFDAVSETINVLKGNRLDGLVKNNNQILNEMKSTLDFVKNNLVSALSEQNTLQIELDELGKQIKEYQSQIEQERASSRDVSNVIVVNVYSDKNTTLPVTVSYVTTQAGWKPIYDVRVADINSPLQLTYKADVYQRSGLDWYNVDFSLSTSNPSEGITAPTLFPWQVNIYNEKTGYSFYSKNAKYSADDSIMYGVSEVSAEGKQSISRPAPPVENVLINTSGINTKFDVKLPYTIKSNSTNNVLTLQDKQVKAQYRYISTPKLDSNVFLQAQITDWDRLNLLPGKSTVFFNGNYIGESFLTTEGAKETLDLSLGRDKNILITRNRDVNETSKPSFFGNDVSQKYAYTIDVKNTKTLPIDITVYDQLPVIQNKAITLEDVKYDGATYDKETGLLTWTSLLSPSETKTFKLSFQLTYPKDKANSIIGL